MKKLVFLLLLNLSFSSKAQSLIQSVNSGSIIASNSMVSVGEIIIVPQNQSQSSSGIIGILAQTNQALEVPQLQLNDQLVVYPNPTKALLTFKTDVNLSNEKVFIYSVTGQLVAEKYMDATNSLDVSSLSEGIYLLQFANKNIASFKIIKH